MDLLKKSFFISATDTGVGKTFFSVRIINKLIDSGSFDKKDLAYFKPVQCGEELSKAGSRTDFSYVSEQTGVDVFNSYFFKAPASPHYASSLEAIDISLEKIKDDFDKLTQKYKVVVVEGAGGLAVPLTKDFLVSDLIKTLNLPLLLIARPDLGTINHSLLSIEHARNKELAILGIIFSESNPDLGLSYTISDHEFLEGQRINSKKTILGRTGLQEINL
jgi:dethiobiotin synthetase